MIRYNSLLKRSVSSQNRSYFILFQHEAHKTILDHRATLVAEMKNIFSTKQTENYYCTQRLQPLDTVGAVYERLEELIPYLYRQHRYLV